MDRNYINNLLGKLNPVCRESLEKAVSVAFNRTNYSVDVDHWLVSLAEPGNSQVSAICTEFGISCQQLAAEATARLDELKRGNADTPTLSPRLFDLVREAWSIASIELNSSAITTGHILLALGSDPFRSVIDGTSLELIEFARLKKSFASIVSGAGEQVGPSAGNPPAGAPRRTAASGDELSQFTVDLTEEARAGKIDRIVGRDYEIRQIVDILLRRRQNNPILTGEAGVGKTAVVEGFALKIARGEVPEKLKDVTLLALDLAALQAGASVKGEFERRMKAVIDEVKSSPTPIILFIDEAHNIIGAGGAAGQGDVANLLKPALARGELRTIAATTWAEYKKFIAKDAALERRFQVVKVPEPSVEQAVEMMQSVAPTFEQHHGVTILSDAIRASVEYSQRYLAGRHLPDKAVSVLDTTCARIGLSQTSAPAAVEDAMRKVQALEVTRDILGREHRAGAEHEAAIAEVEQQLAAATARRDELESKWQAETEIVEQIKSVRQQLVQSESDDSHSQLLAQLKQLEQQLVGLQGDRPLVHPLVNSEAVAATIESWTGIPVGKMVAEEINTILNLQRRMEESIIGQSHALEAIAKSIVTWRGEMHDPKKPAGVFLLCGSSGVGKTETALTLARLLFGSEESVVTIEMSQLKSVEMAQTKLFGASAGYVGYGEGGLMEAIRRRPYCVVLLDEFEKAHGSVQHLFYNIFDRGFAQDSDGGEIDFRNTVTLITTNAATDFIRDLCADPDSMPTPEGFKKAVFPVLLKHFEPAFLGRINEIIPFYSLSPEVLAKIVNLKLQKVSRRAKLRYGADLVFDERVRNSIVERCTETDTGARNIDNILTKLVLPEVAAHFLTALAGGTKLSALNVGVDDNGEFTFQEVPALNDPKGGAAQQADSPEPVGA